MTLVLGEETGRTRPAPSGSSSPEDVVRFFFPRRLHIINFIDHHMDRIPTIGVSFGGREVVVGRDENVGVSNTFGRREHRVESVDRSPIAKKVSLMIVCPGMIAEVIFVIHIGGKKEVFRCHTGRHTSISQP
jgi:hypothetical protein